MLTWFTDDTDTGSTNFFTVRVADNGQPILDDSQAFVAVVTKRPIIQSVVASNEQVSVTWSSIPGLHYRLQYKTNTADPSWNDLSPQVTATNAITVAEDVSATNTVRVYRVRSTQ